MENQKTPVWQFRADGTYIREIESLSKAAKLIDSHVSNIRMACERNIKTKGFYWRYASERHPLKINVPPKRRGGKQVFVYKIEKGIKSKYPVLYHSIGEASRATGASESSIRAICKNKRDNFNNEFTFQFKNKEDVNNYLPDFDLYKRKLQPMLQNQNTPVKIINIETGEEHKFSSVNEAARELGISDKGIRHVLAKRYRQTKGYLVEKI